MRQDSRRDVCVYLCVDVGVCVYVYIYHLSNVSHQVGHMSILYNSNDRNLGGHWIDYSGEGHKST